MKKYITLSAILIISMQAIKKHPVTIVTEEAPKPVATLYLHHVVKLILKRITNLEIIA